MTRKEVIVRAMAGRLTWIAAADILGITPRHMRRLKLASERDGYGGLVDQRGRRPRHRRIPVQTIETLCRLRRDSYADFSIQHFWEQATEQHGLELSYTWTRLVLQAAGLAPKLKARGKYRRKRERRLLVGMLVHLDASSHAWLPAHPRQDLVVALDDADGPPQAFVHHEGSGLHSSSSRRSGLALCGSQRLAQPGTRRWAMKITGHPRPSP